MGALVYTALCSLDGYVADTDGRFDWAVPDEDVHAAVNDLERQYGVHLYGRRLYDVMVAWETVDTTGEPDEMRDYAEVWRAAEKVVYSTTLSEPRSARTRIERTFDPDAVRALKESSDRPLTIGGAELAGRAISAGLVDELHLFVSPVVVGGGTKALPDGVHWPLELVDERRFGNGVVHLHFRTRGYTPGRTAPHRQR